jgi:hypothetical protein
MANIIKNNNINNDLQNTAPTVRLSNTNLTKNRDDPRCSGRVGSSYSISDTRRW